jgi:hypothetical protein
VQVKMKKAMPVTVDGVNTVDAAAGDELLVGDGVGSDLIEAGHAEAKDAGGADENKDAGDDAETKPKRAPRKREKKADV